MAQLLGELLHEELVLRWEQLLLDDAFTGGALAWVPGSTPQVGQLVYPAGGALDKLCILSQGSRRCSQHGPGQGQEAGELAVTRVHAFILSERPRFPRGHSDPRQ